MDKNVKDYFNSRKIAVVGASSNKAKYGYKVFNLLKNMGYDVYPVNPKIKVLDEVKVYKSISEIEGDIDAVSIIIPPERADSVLEEIDAKKIPIVWFQPGAESFKLIRYCNSHNIEVIYNRCVLVDAAYHHA